MTGDPSDEGRNIANHELLNSDPANAAVGHDDPESPVPAPLTESTTHDDITLSLPLVSKKRKFDQLSDPKSRSTSRPTSPPWRKAEAKGPTSFVENGRRKSGRVNAIPLELQASADARTTRGALHDAPLGNGRIYAGSSRNNNLSGDGRPASAQTRTKLARKVHAASASAVPSTAGSLKSTVKKPATPSTLHSNPNTHNVARNKSLGNYSKSPKEKPGRLSSTAGTTLAASTPSGSTIVLRPSASKDDPPKERITIKFGRRRTEAPDPTQLRNKITYPGHVPAKPQYETLQDTLDNLDKIQDPDQNQADRDAGVSTTRRKLTYTEEADLRIRLVCAAQSGGLLSDESPAKKPPRQYGHIDHLWAQGAYLRTLIKQEKALHREQAKKYAYACQAVWKARQPKTEEELQQYEVEIVRTRYKQVVTDTAKKWELVTAEITRRRHLDWEKEQEEKDQKRMRQVLQNSEALLDRRKHGLLEDGSKSSELVHEGLTTTREGTTSEDENSSAFGEDDENMSEVSSEDEMEEAADEDADLTPEQLQAKYAHATPVDGGAESEEDVEESDASTDMDDDLGSSDVEQESGTEIADEASSGDLGTLGFLPSEELQTLLPEPPLDIPDALDAVEASAFDDGKILGHAADIADHDHESVLSGGEGEPASSQLSPREDVTTSAPTELDSATSVDLMEPSKSPRSVGFTPQPEERPTRVPVPRLLRGILREYQHDGLDWLARLYATHTNGILADEMGLGKTIQTIALLAHLAEAYQIWGPHLIVVPSSVILNWAREFQKFLPGFKVLPYYGSLREREEKRVGWSNNDKWNVVVTSYQLVLQDIAALRIRPWHYLILDEAHNIKNFDSQRYQKLIRLNTKARLLLTGTPLQNSMEELWSLLTFLTVGESDGQGMGSLRDFKRWFKKPQEQIFDRGVQKLDAEAQRVVDNLHGSLRPYLLRRLKANVEKQMPGKYEHTVVCKLSKRQREYYDEFVGRAETRATLASGNMFSVSKCLMNLRKVCNHPDLFEEREIKTSFAMTPKAVVADYEIKELLVRKRLLANDELKQVNLNFNNLLPLAHERQTRYHSAYSWRLRARGVLQNAVRELQRQTGAPMEFDGSSIASTLAFLGSQSRAKKLGSLRKHVLLNNQRTERWPIWGLDLVKTCTVDTRPMDRSRPLPPSQGAKLSQWFLCTSSIIQEMVLDLDQRAAQMEPLVKRFTCITPKAIANGLTEFTLTRQGVELIRNTHDLLRPDPFHESRICHSIAFPDKRLLQYDCGKLQKLAELLRTLTSRGSRALVFTQMALVLDILERFLNIHGYRYLRLDGSTSIERRQQMMEDFNDDTRIDVFILSSRSGGLGMNLTGADSVIFYDLDWNPQMDRQCQDRAHRIGQTRDVHIYKLISEHTIEVNILRKSNQKRMLDDVVIQEGKFTTEYSAGDRVEAIDDDLSGDAVTGAAMDKILGVDRDNDITRVLEAAEDIEDTRAARAQQKEMANTDFDFDKPDLSTATREASTADAADPMVPVQADTDATADYARPHIDEYMLKFVENYVLKGVRYAPSSDKKGRLDKNGRDRSHRARK
ncbi:swr1 complex component [Elasticomyces elasticus]|nr:swr1 complex component [Elasticomyces elasticus]